MESTCKTKIVSSLLRESGKGKLDFSHPFQRKEGQWTRYMESLEVDSLLRGYSINLVYIWKKDNKNYVIEGKQRITTLQKYKGDKFPLSKKLDPVTIDGETYEIAGKRFSQLDEIVQDKLLNAEVLIFEMWDCKEKEVRDMFVRLNSGKRLNGAQMLTGLLNLDISTELYKIMEHPFWAKTGITKGDIRSDNMRKVACQILMLISGYEYTAFDQKNIEKYVEILNSDSEESIRLIGHALEVLDKLDEKIVDKMDKMKKLSIPMVVAAMDVVYGDEEKENSYLLWLKDFFENYDNQTKYLEYCGRSTDKGENVKGRWEIFSKVVSE